MDAETIVLLLTNNGFHGVQVVNGTLVQIEDPTCLVRTFQTFLEYAWMILVFITGILLATWAWAMIRGGKNASLASIMHNLKNLLIIFGTLSAVGPVVNFFYGEDLFAMGCRTISLDIEDVNKALNLRNAELTNTSAYDIYEQMTIFDSGVVQQDTTDVPEAAAVQKKVTIPSDEENTEVKVADETEHEIIDTGTAPIQTNTEDANLATPVQAVSGPKQGTERVVIYTTGNGRQYKKIGGTAAWRHNNPGNMEYTSIAVKYGAIGQAGRWAIFPDRKTGENAIKKLLKSENYIDRTLAKVIERYAPPSENDTENYYNTVARNTGISIHTLMRDVTDEQLGKIVKEISRIEGWKPGKIEYIED